MKKLLKKVLIFALLAGMLCSFCGCTAIDKMRESQAFSQPDGSILWRGSVYKLLQNSQDLYPEMGEDSAFVTAPDVPVLLSTMLMDAVLRASKDSRFLMDDREYIYCREDAYEEITERLSQGFTPEIYCYFYDLYDEESWDFVQRHYTLTEDEVAAIELVTGTVEPYAASALGRPEAQYSVYLYACSADMLLQKCSTEILATTVGYSLLVYTDTDVMVFPVPEGLNDTFRRMLHTYVTADQFTDWESDV